ncbi:MAG: hypothetical protein ACTFAK_00810 [Candidatus Electronema sp. VV]
MPICAKCSSLTAGAAGRKGKNAAGRTEGIGSLRLAQAVYAVALSAITVDTAPRANAAG